MRKFLVAAAPALLVAACGGDAGEASKELSARNKQRHFRFVGSSVRRFVGSLVRRFPPSAPLRRVAPKLVRIRPAKADVGSSVQGREVRSLAMRATEVAPYLMGRSSTNSRRRAGFDHRQCHTFSSDGGRKQLAARPVDTRIPANSRKRGGGLTGRGDGGPHAHQKYCRSRVLQTDSRAASELLSPAIRSQPGVKPDTHVGVVVLEESLRRATAHHTAPA